VYGEWVLHKFSLDMSNRRVTSGHFCAALATPCRSFYAAAARSSMTNHK
jgi:hypothetical protein